MSAPWAAEARKYVGLREIVGSEHEAEIVKFFADAGHPWVKDDETAWCAAFANAMLVRSGWKGTGSLAARSFLSWGEKLDEPRPGCVVVLKRGSASWQGHVGFFVSRSAGRVKVLGGNQSNAVTDNATFPEEDVLGYRWPTQRALRTKPLHKSKIAGGAATVGGVEAADAAVIASDVLDKVTTAHDVSERLGMTDKILAVATNPRFILAVAVVLICAAIVYWRWREHGRGS